MGSIFTVECRFDLS